MFRDDPETLALVAGLSRGRRAYRYRGPDIAEPTVEEVEALTARSWPVHGPLTPSALPAGPVHERVRGGAFDFSPHTTVPPARSRPTPPPASPPPPPVWTHPPNPDRPSVNAPWSPPPTVPPITPGMHCRLRYADGTVADVPIDAEGNFISPHRGQLMSVTLIDPCVGQVWSVPLRG